MTVTAEQLARLRRMVAEPGATSTYTDAALALYVERYALDDDLGEPPLTMGTAWPPALVPNPWWKPTYDLNAAAADVWEEKAGAVATSFDFTTDGQSFSRSQSFEMAMKQARFYRARRAMRSVTLRPEPIRSGTADWPWTSEEQ